MPRNVGYLYLGTHPVKGIGPTPTNVGHILWQVYVEMFGTYSMRGIPGYMHIL